MGGHFFIMKRCIHQEEIKLLNIHSPYKRPAKYLKQFLKNININTLILGDFYTVLSSHNISTRQKLNKDILGLQ